MQFLYVAKAEILVDYLHYRVAYIFNNVAEWIINKEVLFKFLKYKYGFVHGKCSIKYLIFLPLLFKSVNQSKKYVGEHLFFHFLFRRKHMVLVAKETVIIHVLHSIFGSRPVLIMSRLQDKSIFKIIL